MDELQVVEQPTSDVARKAKQEVRSVVLEVVYSMTVATHRQEQ